MKISQKNLILGMSSIAVLLFAFQNCSQTRFSGADQVQLKSSDENGNSVPVVDGGTTPTPTMTPGPATQDPRQTDAREVKCESTLVKAAIAYDAIPAANAAAVSFNGTLPSTINAENISFIGNSAVENLSVTARRVDQIGSMAAQKISVNAQTIGSVSTLAVGSMHLVAHSVSDPSRYAGRLCISAQRVPSISDAAGAITVFGRGENGQRATIDFIGRVGSFMSLYDVDVKEISNLATFAKFDNVTVKSLGAGAGEVILVNSRIDLVDQFSGTIRLRGSSSIGSITQQNAVRIIKE